jgi:hypothetical protein
MTQIIAFAGKKQSGKNTACNFVLAMKLSELAICKVSRLSKKGEIEVSDVLGETHSDMEWIPFRSPYIDTEGLFNNELSLFVKMYGLADALKEMAISILDLDYQQVFGTDSDKNSKTKLKWENMPAVITPSELKKRGVSREDAEKLGMIVHEKGTMTAREVLQYVGTDVFRKMNSDVWLNSLLNKIESDAPELALISDVRFENEIEVIQKNKGFVIGLTRDPYEESDRHSSESEIERCLGACDIIVDNSSLTIPEQNEKIYYALEHLNDVMPRLSYQEEGVIGKE